MGVVPGCRPFHISWGVGGRGGDFGEGSVPPLIPSLHCPPPAALPLPGEGGHMLPGARGRGGAAEVGGMFSSAEHSCFGPGPVPRGKIHSG